MTLAAAKPFRQLPRRNKVVELPSSEPAVGRSNKRGDRRLAQMQATLPLLESPTERSVLSFNLLIPVTTPRDKGILRKLLMSNLIRAMDLSWLAIGIDRSANPTQKITDHVCITTELRCTTKSGQRRLIRKVKSKRQLNIRSATKNCAFRLRPTPKRFLSASSTNRKSTQFRIFPAVDTGSGG
jgi:hypothetical protein